MPAKKYFDAELITLVADEIAKEPYEFDGHAWAVLLTGQDSLADHLGVCTRTLSARLKVAPFKSRTKRIDGERCTLIRFREPGEPDVTPQEQRRAKTNAARKAMSVAWKAEIGELPDYDQGTLMWGFAFDLSDFPEVDPVQVFKDSLKHWTHTASAIKLAQLATPGGKPKYYDFPALGPMRVFWKAVLYAYVSRQMEAGKVPSDKLNAFAAILNATEFDLITTEPSYTEEHIAGLMAQKAAKQTAECNLPGL